MSNEVEKFQQKTIADSIDDCCRLLAGLEANVGALFAPEKSEIVQTGYERLRAEADGLLALHDERTVLGKYRERVRKLGEERNRRQAEMAMLVSRDRRTGRGR